MQKCQRRPGFEEDKRVTLDTSWHGQYIAEWGVGVGVGGKERGGVGGRGGMGRSGEGVGGVAGL